ncbi:putative integrase [Agrobacterium rubi TR3 = NBRC 13261]|uniref:Putative integrase n=1 Tax=Agrobacterium rubi TR3 = NBRC 13261 TaxID=1368415 RepID=A0A081CWX8_9HYPH|nr:site-specific integrase [Agrobacterium rubi]MBP1878141.1 integrase [Agrobacterium rubi]GAK71174.1 putative integrase [Agrobacterium rubi TR3 = NBRC 13261]
MAKRSAKTLTILAVKGAQGNGVTRQEIPDAALPGLYLVIQPGGSKSWALRYRQDGKPAKLTLGPVINERESPLDGDPSIGSGMTLTEARKVARRELQALTEGQSLARRKAEVAVLAASKALDEDFLVERLASKFIERYAKPKNKTWTETERQFKKEIGYRDEATGTTFKADWFGRDVRDLRKADVVKLLDSIVDRGSAITSNRVYATLSTWFGWMVGRDIIASNPMTGLRKLSVESSRDRILTDDELRVFWAATLAHPYPFGPMWRLLLVTAQRRQEVAGLEWSELSLGDDPHWLLPRSRSKNGRENFLPLCDMGKAELKAIDRQKGQRFVFSTTGQTAVSGFSRSKARLDATMVAIMQQEANERGEDASKVRLQQWGLHDLRRTAASGMARLGQPIHVIEAILNHTGGSISGVAAVYNRHDYRDEKRSALIAWEDFVSRLVTTESAGNVIQLRNGRL